MFVGEQREKVVKDLVLAFDRVRASKRPEMVVLESETGLGKTRVLQEFYARLASDRQGAPPYWPDRLDTQATGDVLRDRKRIAPATPFTIPGGARLPYLWWGIACEDDDAGVPVPRLISSAGQFDIHAKHLGERAPDRVDAALTLVKTVSEIVGLNPLKLAVNAPDFFKNAAAFFQNLRRRATAPKELTADRRIASTATNDDDRCRRLADAVRVAANGGLPVVVVVDDAHYADATLVSFLRQLTQVDSGSLLIVASAWPWLLRQRSEGDAASMGAFLGSTSDLFKERFRRISLGKLERGDVARLLEDVAPRTRPELVERFCDVIDGNPLLLRLYLNLDAIRVDIRDGALDVDPAKFGRLPSDAKGVWQALWRQLPEPTRFALAVVSMQGPEFHPGFLERAAADLRNYDAVKGLDGAQRTYGWVAPPVADLASFTERLRYEVAHDNLVEQLAPEQRTVVRKALVAHALETKASPNWDQLPAATRRLILRSHLSVAREEPEIAAIPDLADSAYRLSSLEQEAGDEDSALVAAREAVELGRQGGGGEALLLYQHHLGQLEKGAGNDAAAFDAMNEAEVLSRAVLGKDSAAIAVLQEEVAELAVAAARAATDVGSDHGPEPWVAWAPRDVPELQTQSLGTLADLIAQVARTEGPLTYGRLYRLLAEASGAKFAGKAMRDRIDRAVGSGVRRRLLTSETPYRGCDADERIVAAIGTPAVKIRPRGERTLDEVPLTELAAVAEREMTADPDASVEDVARAVMAAYDTKRLTDRIHGLMKRAIDIAKRERAKAASEDETWSRMHRAIAAIPVGRWTALQDLAELAETSPGWVGRHLYGKWDLPGLHRVLEADGRPWRWFQWPAGADPGDVVAVLQAEGVIHGDEPVAAGGLRLGVSDLRQLVEA